MGPLPLLVLVRSQGNNSLSFSDLAMEEGEASTNTNIEAHQEVHDNAPEIVQCITH